MPRITMLHLSSPVRIQFKHSLEILTTDNFGQQFCDIPLVRLGMLSGPDTTQTIYDPIHYIDPLALLLPGGPGAPR